MLGDKKVEYNNDFRLYLITNLPNPTYGPKIFSNAIVVNFTVTEVALENQLLEVILEHEQSNLAKRKKTLIHNSRFVIVTLLLLHQDLEYFKALHIDNLIPKTNKFADPSLGELFSKTTLNFSDVIE